VKSTKQDPTNHRGTHRLWVAFGDNVLHGTLFQPFCVQQYHCFLFTQNWQLGYIS